MQIRKDLFRCGEGRMVFSIRDCDNASDLLPLIEGGGGLAILSDDYSYDGDGGPYTISLLDETKNVDECSLREAFSSKFILMSCSKNTILPLKNYWLKRSGRFNAFFDPQDVLLQKISWLDAESLYSHSISTENSSSTSVVKLSISQPLIKLEKLELSAVITPPLFTEDEGTQENSHVLTPLNGLVPIIKLERIDQASTLDECSRMCMKRTENCDTKSFKVLGLEKKLPTEKELLKTPTGSLDSNKNEPTIIAKKYSNPKRKLCSSSAESESGLSDIVLLKQQNKIVNANSPKKVKRQTHRRSLRKVCKADSSSSDSDEASNVIPKKKLMPNRKCQNSNQVNKRGPKTTDLQSQVNARTDDFSSSADENKEVMSENGLRTPDDNSEWPKTFDKEVLIYNDTTNCDSSSNDKLDKIVGETTVQRESQSSTQRSTGQSVSSGESIRLILDPCSSAGEDEKHTMTRKMRDSTVQCCFEEPLTKDSGVQTKPAKIIPLDCFLAESLPYQESCETSVRASQPILEAENSLDFICQTDFDEPDLCDKECQTKAVLVQSVPMKDLDSSADAVHIRHTEGEISNCSPLESFKSCESEQLTPETQTSSIDASEYVTPDGNSEQESPSKRSSKRGSKQTKVSNAVDRRTRSSLRKETRLYVSNHKKSYS